MGEQVSTNNASPFGHTFVHGVDGASWECTAGGAVASCTLFARGAQAGPERGTAAAVAGAGVGSD